MKLSKKSRATGTVPGKLGIDPELTGEKRVILRQAGEPSRPREAIRLAIIDKDFSYREWVRTKKARSHRAKA